MGLLNRAVISIKWASISQVGRQFIQYIATLILVSLLAPNEFGLMATALIIVNFLELFKDLGTSSAIIQRISISDSLLSSVFWLNVSFGLLIFAIIFFSSPVLADFFNNNKLILILKVLPVVFIISSLSNVQRALLEKELHFNLISKIELGSTIFGALIGVFLAFKGFGVWSLVYQTISNLSLATILFFICSKWKPSVSFNIKEIKSISSFSINLVGFNFFNFFARNADYLIIAKFLGEVQLGHYYLIYRIMLYPIQNISQVISRVVFPVYSKIQHDNVKLSKAFKDVTSSIAIFTFPLMLGLIAISNLFIHSFFGSKWDYNLLVSLLIVLAPVGLMQSLTSNVGSLYLSKARTDLFLKWGILSSIVYVVGFLIGIKWGAWGVALSYLITNIILFYPVFAIPFKLINLNFLTFIKNLNGTILSALIMACIVFLSGIYISKFLENTISLIIVCLIGVISYFLISLKINRNKILFIFSMLKMNKILS